MKIYPDCGYFNERRKISNLPYPGECEVATGMRHTWKRKERKAQKRYGENK